MRMLDDYKYEPRTKPRDFFTDKHQRMWSDDQTVMHYEGDEIRIKWPLIKISCATVIFIFVWLLTGYKSLALITVMICTGFY